MASPLSMIAKGVQSIGLNLGTHKVCHGTFLYFIYNLLIQQPAQHHIDSSPPSPTERHASAVKDLEEMWDKEKCRTKLIAL